MSKSEIPKRLYRIMDFTRVVQIFEKNEMYFANPGTWEDPYERRIRHSRDHALFAQCWCQLGISDAMWRIYSQNGMGVRISTTDRKLKAALTPAARDKGFIFRLGEVDYKSQLDLNVEARKIADELREEFSMERAVDMLYMKREAFRHESEWRATIFCPNEKRGQIKKRARDSD